MKPEFVLYDVGNVLVTTDLSRTYSAFLSFGVNPNYAHLGFNSKYLPEYREFSKGKIGENEFCEAVRSLLDAPHLTIGQIREAHDAHIVGVDPMVYNAITRTKGRIGFATDTNTWQHVRVEKLLGHSLDRFGGPVFESHTLGSYKDENGTFRKIIGKIGIDSHKIVLIDDSLPNIGKAEFAGMQAYRFVGADPLFSYLTKEDLLN